MMDAIAETLLPGVASGISVVPILAVVVVLTATGGRAKAAVFVLLWFLALTAIAFVAALMGSGWTVDEDAAEPSASGGWVQLALGVLLLWLAVGQWRSRPRGDGEPPTPGWLKTIDQMSVVKTGALGGVLGLANVKNLPLAIGVGISIAQADLGTGEGLVVAIVYGAVASLGVLAPLVVAVVLGDRSGSVIEGMRSWLIAYNNVIMAVIFLLLGVNFVSQGVAVVG
jgi:cytochrome c biogenesis protein CcdA